MVNSLGTVLDPKKSKAKYPEARVIVLDDNFNTFQHVANCLLTIIPSMSEQRAWDLTIKVDKAGSAEVWSSEGRSVCRSPCLSGQGARISSRCMWVA